MKTRIGKQFRFEAAHRLPNHPGVCSRLHGHSYRLEVVLEGEVAVLSGMIMDFETLSEIVNRIVLDDLDHHYLNEPITVPTAENLARWIFRELEPEFGGLLWSVKVWETEKCWAEMSRGIGDIVPEQD